MTQTLNNLKYSKAESRAQAEIRLKESLYRNLADIMNELHGMDYSERFWKLVAGSHVTAVVSRKRELSEKELIRNADLYPVNSYGFPSTKEKYKRWLILTLKHLKTAGDKRKIEKALMGGDEFHIGFPELPALENGELGKRLPEYYPFFIGIGDKHKRERLQDIANTYENIFLKNVIHELPKILVEHFEALLQEIPLLEPENKIFHRHMTGSFYMKVLLAKYVEHGSRLVWHQHGSEFGEFEEDIEHYFQSSVSDEFRTWGWSRYDNDKPGKAYRLELFRIAYDNIPGKNDYDLLLCFPSLGSKKKIIIAATKNLLGGLHRLKYRKILARPRRSNKLHSHKRELKFIDDSRVVKSSGLSAIHKEISRCRLVVQLHVPSTNFLECIYVDHPVMGILRNSKPSRMIKPFYRFFLEKGVLHEDMDSLVDHLNDIELEVWWEGVKNEPMYQEFKNTFTKAV